jgi:hypothetical protein
MSRNARLATSRDSSPEASYHDGFAEYEYNKVFTSAWALAGQVPVTVEWAIALAELYHQLRSGYNRDEIPAMIERWRPAQDAQPFEAVREALARQVKPTLSMLRADDVALRRAFYATFDPADRDFRELDWLTWYERDPIDCLIWLDGNRRVWKLQSSREKLFALYSADARKRSDYVHIGWARKREEEWRGLHPEWFIEDMMPEDREPTSRDIFDRIAALDMKTTSSFQAFERSTSSRWGAIVGALILLAIGYFLGISSRGY